MTWHILIFKHPRCYNIITWSYWFINLDFTYFSLLPSSIGAKSCSSFTVTQFISPKPLTCSSRLQPVHQAKSCLDLLHLDHMTQCHVSFTISSFIITCVSFATSPRHFHLHSICCSHSCTCGLITCVSHINTISLPRLSLNYQNHTGTFQWLYPFLMKTIHRVKSSPWHGFLHTLTLRL